MKRSITIATAVSALAVLYPLAATAGGPAAVTIHSTEFFPASGGATATFVATGGVFGSGTSGTQDSTFAFAGSRAGQLHRAAAVVHGVDVNMTAAGTFTWAFSAHCSFISATQALCGGTWHIVDGSGAYAGAQGEGTLSDLLTFDELGNATGDDTFTGRIQIK
jgi:hypothetical protein